MQQTDIESLREQHPDAWIPLEPGDSLSGTIREVRRGWSDMRAAKNGEGWYPLLVIETDDGVMLNWHAFSAVAYTRIMEIQPVPGEKVTITYLGLSRVKKAGQNPAKLFSIRVDSRDPVTQAANVYQQLNSHRKEEASADELPF